MECLRSMRHMIHFFSLRDVRLLLLHFYITTLKMLQADSPWGRGGFSFFCLFVSQDLSPEQLQFIFVMRHRFGPPPSNWMLLVPYDPMVEKKKCIFFTFQMCTQLSQGMCYLSLILHHQKKSCLTFSKIHKINIFLSSHPPLLPNNN